MLGEQHLAFFGLQLDHAVTYPTHFEVADDDGDILEDVALQGELYPLRPIGKETIVLIVGRMLQHLTLYEHSLVADVVSAEEVERDVLWRSLTLLTPVGICLHPIAIEDVSLTGLAENLFQYGGIVKGVAGVHKDKIISSSVLQGLVHRVVRSLVRLTAPIGDLRLMCLNEIPVAFRAAAIYDNPLPVLVGLNHDALKGLLQPFQMIPIDGDDRYLHR